MEYSGPGAHRAWPRPRRPPSNVCTQCRRQKQKCDRQTPCSNCVRRGIPHLCLVPTSPYPEPGPRERLSEFALSAEPEPTRLPRPPGPEAQISLPHSPSSGRPSQTHMGRIWNSRGAPSYHGDSYFGHQAAAVMMQVDTPELPVGVRGIHAAARRRGMTNNHQSALGLYAHIWELVGHLPRRKAMVDSLTQKFFDELNEVFDGVHQETFLKHYDRFWDRKWGDDDLTSVDLRWLGLLFIVLAFGELLDCPLEPSPERQRECEESSLQFFWASRKAVVLAPTFSGESPDLVRAGILISRYLLYLGRKAEGWLTSSFAVRMAQAQGMHVDGENWRLPPKVLQTRRCLWSSLYTLDRSFSLAVGRPYTINDKHCMQMKIANVVIDTDGADGDETVVERPLSDPSPILYLLYQQKLSAMLGNIQDECFGLVPMTTSYETYEKVLKIDDMLVEWASSLPSYFSLDDPDRSMDQERSYLRWQRLYLHSQFHFARITLHRAYVLLDSITDRFKFSREVCINSACSDLRLKLGFRNMSMADRIKASSSSLNLFNSALVLGVMAVRDPLSPGTSAILEDIQVYCDKQKADIWANETTLAEVKVIELCIASARKSRHEASLGVRASDERPGADADDTPERRLQSRYNRPALRAGRATNQPETGPAASAVLETGYDLRDTESWLDTWFGQARAFPEPSDFHLWEDLVGTLESRQ
ncbi:hypothetical protein GQ53DRAFT_510837 [Thozetella sp. PMI_491]|nr:hypothetical protein GQ53DRAFT_510837 [Thozetella sp. PMI_491]